MTMVYYIGAHLALVNTLGEALGSMSANNWYFYFDADNENAVSFNK